MRSSNKTLNKPLNGVKTMNKPLNSVKTMNKSLNGVKTKNKTFNKVYKSPSINKSKKRSLWSFLGFKSRK